MSNIILDSNETTEQEIKNLNPEDLIYAREYRMFAFLSTFYPIPVKYYHGAWMIQQEYNLDPFLEEFHDAYLGSLLRGNYVVWVRDLKGNVVDETNLLLHKGGRVPILTKEIVDKHIQWACDCIKNSFDNESPYYTASFFNKLFIKLDFFNIKFNYINVQEMECCLDNLKNREEELKNIIRVLNIRDMLLHELDRYLSFYGSEIQNHILESQPFNKVEHLMFEISDISREILLNKSNKIDDLMKKIQEIDVEIDAINKEIYKKENWAWRVDNCEYREFMRDLLPHNYAKAFVNEFVKPNIKNIDEVLQTDCDIVLSWNNEGHELEEMTYRPSNILDFYYNTIRELTMFVNFLKRNDEIQKTKEILSYYNWYNNIDEFYTLLNYFIKCYNNSLEKGKNITRKKYKETCYIGDIYDYYDKRRDII